MNEPVTLRTLVCGTAIAVAFALPLAGFYYFGITNAGGRAGEQLRKDAPAILLGLFFVMVFSGMLLALAMR